MLNISRKRNLSAQDEPNDEFISPNPKISDSDSDVNQDQDQDQNEIKNHNKELEKQPRKKKKGIIYLSSIPKYMTVSIAREIFGRYGEVGRVFFQPEKDLHGAGDGKKKRKRRHFAEGWIEFESKRAAKSIAATLNNMPIATRKSSKFYDILWSMKYLPRFKWVHLTERLTYEKEVYKHKLQAEISQAKREASFFQDNLDKSEHLKKKNNKSKKQKIA